MSAATAAQQSAGHAAAPAAAAGDCPAATKHALAIELLRVAGHSTFQGVPVPWLAALAPMAHWLWADPAEHNAPTGGADAHQASGAGAISAPWVSAVQALRSCGQYPPGAVLHVLRWAGPGFRALPPRLLAMAVERWVGAVRSGASFAPNLNAQRLAQLQIEHVLAWVKTHGDNAALFDTNPEWADCVSAAQAWRECDELTLRMAPQKWAFARSNMALSVSDFVITPVTSTAQLLAATDHRDVLCRVQRARACAEGREAWVMVEPPAWVAGTRNEPLFWIGWRRNEPSPEDGDGSWSEQTAVYGPPHARPWLENLAIALNAAASRQEAQARMEAFRQHYRRPHSAAFATGQA